MIAILLCAGFGTRMEDGTDAEDAGTPKPLLSVGDASFLDFLAADLARADALDAIHVVANHRHVEAFRAWADVRGPEYAEHGTDLHVHDDGVTAPADRLGAVGDLRFVLDRVDVPSGGACVAGGDSLYRFPLAPLVDAFDGQTSQVLALYTPDEEAQRHSSLLRLDGTRVQGVVDAGELSAADRAETEPYVCPLFDLLTPQDLRAVGPYLDAGHDPDDVGPFVDVLAQTRRVDALRLPARSDLRIHCNTPDALAQARSLLAEAPRLLVDDDQVRAWLDETASTTRR